MDYVNFVHALLDDFKYEIRKKTYLLSLFFKKKFLLSSFSIFDGYFIAYIKLTKLNQIISLLSSQYWPTVLNYICQFFFFFEDCYF